MDGPSLEAFLEAGLSVEAIGQRVNRDPSTVRYWMKKHGLVPNGHEAHRAKGALHREELIRLIDDGASIATIAATLATSETRVRYWLRKFGLSTRNGARRRGAREAKLRGQATVRLLCRHHGMTEFWLEGRGNYRCLRCRWEAVARRRRKVEALLIGEAGGRCRICGYQRCQAAMQFHHLDRGQKGFALAGMGATRAIDKMREEARKCVLLCANCHAELEAGIVTLP